MRTLNEMRRQVKRESAAALKRYRNNPEMLLIEFERIQIREMLRAAQENRIELDEIRRDFLNSAV